MSTLYILITIFFVIIIIYLYSQSSKQNLFETESKKLFSISSKIDKKVNFENLKSLPKPVQIYFQNVLKNGSDYISNARLKHNGKFKTTVESNWIDIVGVEYFSSKEPGFVWRGQTSYFTAIDKYIDTSGGLTVKLLNLLKIVDAQGKEYDEGEFMRWLTEAVLFPTALLPSEIIQWLAIDDENAKLIANYDVISVEVDVHFKGGVIDSMRTYRYMGKEGYKEWLLNMDDYKWIKDYQIPMHLQASWRLEEKLHTYVDFYIQEIEYDV